MRRSVHADAGDDAAFTNRRSSRLFIADLCQLALLTFVVIMLPWYYALYDLPPEFAVQLEPAAAGHQHGLINSMSSSPAAAAAASASAFHGTLHASNRRATERCYHHGDAAVTYGGFTVASSGRVPGFCVPGKGRREVPFVARTDDAGATVGLPEHLRARAADEAAMVGALELGVQIVLFHDDGAGGGAATAASSGGTPSRRMWCTARVGGAQPPEVALCTVFALQN